MRLVLGVACSRDMSCDPKSNLNRAKTLRKHNLLLIILLCHLDEAVEVPVILEHSGINQLVLSLCFTAFCIFGHQVFVWELSLWVLVEVLHV